ncbi:MULTISPECIES: hypothetical protein [Halorussus]|uniref:hypothetical protein n=1 Tax=Halorussus TaxID=1070314 RepID=UPI00209EE519|nr:hypothetical protein [Halorussus vallis]USZ74108.1 hypothetical protein NGM07_11660 [Halorussus vallis]
MNRERLGRRLSVVLVLTGVALSLLTVAIGDVVGAIVGALSIGVGVTFYSASNWVFDPDIEFDLTESRPFTASLMQLGLVLVGFAVLVKLVSDVRTVTNAFRTGVPSPPYVACAGLLMGVVLGGGNTYLTHRWDTLEELSRSVPVRMVGFSFTFGVFAVLLVYRPPSSVLYAGAYAVSRLAVILGVRSLSRS